MRGFLRVGVVAACLAVAGSLTLAQESDVRMVAVDGEGAKYWPVGAPRDRDWDRHLSGQWWRLKTSRKKPYRVAETLYMVGATNLF